MKRAWTIATVLLMVSAGICAPRSLNVSASGRALEPAGKKVCKTVTKKVAGKKKQVKECRVMRPAPTVSPTSTPGPRIFVQPDIVALDSAGNILVGDSGAAQIVKLTPAGQVLARWSVSQDPVLKQGPLFTGMAVDRNGDIFIADEAGFRLLKLSPSGRVLTTWDVPSKANPNRYYGPSGIAIDANGNVLTADFDPSQVEKYSPSGVLLATIGHECDHPDARPFVCLPENNVPPGALNKPIGVALDAKGSIYVADHRSFRIVKFSPAGQQLAAFGPELPNHFGRLGLVGGVAVDSRGNIYVDDWGTTVRLLKLSPSGRPLAQWIPSGPYTPQGGGVFDSQGNLYVTVGGDLTHPHYLAKLSPDLKPLARWY